MSQMDSQPSAETTAERVAAAFSRSAGTVTVTSERSNVIVSPGSNASASPVAATSEPPELHNDSPTARSSEPWNSTLDKQLPAMRVRPFPTLWGAGFIVVTLLFIGGLIIGQNFLVDRPANAGLRVDPKYLDFGEAWAESQFKWRIPIQNISDRPARIAEFNASCQCSLIEPSSVTIPPHSTAEVVATVDLTLGRDIDANKSIRKFEISIHPVVDERITASSPPAFILQGTAKELFTAWPREIELGEVLSQTVGQAKTIRLKAAIPLSSVTVLPQPDMTIDIQPVESTVVGTEHLRLAGNDLRRRSALESTEYLLTMRPTDQISVGRVDRELLLQGTDLQGHLLPLFPVKLTGTIVSDVAVEPRQIYAGMIQQGTTFETIITIRSRTGSRFALIPVDQEPGISLTPVSLFGGLPVSESPADPFLSDGGLLQSSFRLRIVPRSHGGQLTMARFHAVSLITNEELNLQIPIEYYGAQPRAVYPDEVLQSLAIDRVRQ